MKAEAPLVGVIMGSKSDLPVLDPALDLFESWNVPYEVLVASAHRTPGIVTDWVMGAEGRGLQVIIAAAGGAAHLPGVVASKTTLPIIGVPVKGKTLAGEDSLYSIVQMPPGIPVATVGINGGINAAVLALEILARVDNKFRDVLLDYRSGWQAKVDRQNEELRAERPGAVPYSYETASQDVQPPAGQGSSATEPEIRPVDFSKPLNPSGHIHTDPTDSHESKIQVIGSAGKVAVRREPQYVGRVEVDSEILSLEIAEVATDCLLDGGIVAIPTETVYGLVVDATNPAAVERLYAIKGRDRGKPTTIFIESQRELASLVRNLSTDVRRMLEAFWPGALTVVFERRGEDLRHLSPDSTLGVRLPNHSISLSLLQELHRPMASTSANPTGAPPARSANEIEQYLGRGVHMILDVGKLPARPPSTIVDVTEQPYRLLREGAITQDQLSAVLGDLITSETSV